MSESKQPDAAECVHVLAKVYQFLDHEIDAADCDAIRQHLADCEPCLDRYDVEQAVKTLVGRCCGTDLAPEHLRSKVLGEIAKVQRQAAGQL